MQGERFGNALGASVVIGLSLAANSSYIPYYGVENTPIPYIAVSFANDITAGYTLDLATGNIIF